MNITHVDNLYQIRDARRLEDVGEMLLKSKPPPDVSAFDRKREVREYVGDYVLFMTALSQESLGRW